MGRWEFKVTRQTDGRFRLDVFVSGDLDWDGKITDLLCGSNPNLYCCSEVRIKSDNCILSSYKQGDLFQHKSSSNRLTFSEVGQWDFEKPHISLIGFGKGNLPKEFSNPNLVEEFFRSHTWAGNREHKTSSATFGWKVLASDLKTIQPRNLAEFHEQPMLTREYEHDGVKMTVFFGQSNRQSKYRVQGLV